MQTSGTLLSSTPSTTPPPANKHRLTNGDIFHNHIGEDKEQNKIKDKLSPLISDCDSDYTNVRYDLYAVSVSIFSFFLFSLLIPYKNLSF